jgi:hypothetical protein
VDAAGELYIFTKTDGVLRAVVGGMASQRWTHPLR